MSLDVSFDIKNIIYSYFYDLKDAINLYNINKDHQDNIRITNLYDIPEIYLKKLDQKTIQQDKYRYVEKFNADNNDKIHNLNHMKNTQVDRGGQKFQKICCLLKILCCTGNNEIDLNGNSGIDQDGIAQLSLIELYACDNKKIKNVNHMKNTLKILHCGYNCGIDQDGISQLNLIELYTILINSTIVTTM